MSRYSTTHPGAQAVTLREASAPAASGPMISEAHRYPRQAGGDYRVVHDRTAHQGAGMYRVFVGQLEVGRQASYPGADDCARLERGSKPHVSAPRLPYGRNSLPPRNRGKKRA